MSSWSIFEVGPGFLYDPVPASPHLSGITIDSTGTTPSPCWYMWRLTRFYNRATAWLTVSSKWHMCQKTRSSFVQLNLCWPLISQALSKKFYWNIYQNIFNQEYAFKMLYVKWQANILVTTSFHIHWKKKCQTLDFTQLWQMQNPMVKKTEFCHSILHGIEKNM